VKGQVAHLQRQAGSAVIDARALHEGRRDNSRLAVVIVGKEVAKDEQQPVRLLVEDVVSGRVHLRGLPGKTLRELRARSPDTNRMHR